MADVRAVFIAIVVLFTLVIGYWTFTLIQGAYVKPLIDSYAPENGDSGISRSEYLRISDNLYTSRNIVFLMGFAIVLFGAFMFYLYFREETAVRFGG